MGVAEGMGLRGGAPAAGLGVGPAWPGGWASLARPWGWLGSDLDESLVEQQAPAGMGLGALAAGAGQVLLG